MEHHSQRAALDRLVAPPTLLCPYFFLAAKLLWHRQIRVGQRVPDLRERCHKCSGKPLSKASLAFRSPSRESRSESVRTPTISNLAHSTFGIDISYPPEANPQTL